MSTTNEDKDAGNDPSDDPSKDQTGFLIDVILHTESKKLEKVDWKGLAEKMGVTKNAAYKRYDRLLKAYGLNRSFQPKDGTDPAGGPRSPAPGPKTATPKKKRASKRKRSDLKEEDEAKEFLDEA